MTKHRFGKVGAWAAGAAAAIVLLMLSTTAMALGLGEIRVKSQPGQPLLAEIPIISSEPGELEQLQARLASPVTFERVGLARPEGLVSGLGFAIALGDDGTAVIRVTSTEPVQVAAVNFLIEVDWGRAGCAGIFGAGDTPGRSPPPARRNRACGIALQHISRARQGCRAQPDPPARGPPSRRGRRRPPPSPRTPLGGRLAKPARNAAKSNPLARPCRRSRQRWGRAIGSTRPCWRCCAPTRKRSSTAISTA